MTISAIKAQVKNTERISVYVDGVYSFSLTYNQLLDQKLRIGLEISDARLAELKHISEFGKAYERALNYVMIRPRSEREVRDYAWRKKWAPEDTEAIIEKLRHRRYINDHNFARAWVQSRALTKNMSQRKLIAELRQKGVASDIITEVLSGEDYDEHAALRALVAKKRKLARYASDDQKLMRYLAGQGFGFEDIKAVISDV